MTVKTVDVIIPTLADSNRTNQLRRAIHSVLAQSGVQANPIVVVNGDRYDKGTLAELTEWDRVQVHRQDESSLPLAITSGRRLVRSSFYSFLDDDDIYRDHTSHVRIAPMLADQEIDFVVGNGCVSNDAGVLQQKYVDFDTFRNDPLEALTRSNWLASCGATFRTSAVGEPYFEDGTKYHEWTFFAFRMMLAGLRVFFVNEDTFCINVTPGSLSRDTPSVRSRPAAIQRLLTLAGLAKGTRKSLKRKYVHATHNLCALELEEGDLRNAFRSHLKSMTSFYGFVRHVAYSRKLIPLALRAIQNRM